MTDEIVNNAQILFKGMMCVVGHMAKGHGIHVTKWRWERDTRFEVGMDGVLVVPHVIHEVSVYPVGTFHCARCDQITEMCRDRKPWGDVLGQALMCDDCFFQHTDVECVPISSTFPADIIPSLVITQGVEYIDNSNEQETMTHAHHFCQLVAQNDDQLIYYKGLNCQDIHREFLAKRVIGKWRNIIQKRNTANMFRVLYQNAELGMDASMQIAKKCFMIA